MAAADD